MREQGSSSSSQPSSQARSSDSGFDLTPLDGQAIKRLAGDLTPEEARVLLRSGTEPPYCGTLLDNKTDGVYLCRLCGLPLFDSGSKFTSGTGWPSFFQPFDSGHVAMTEDSSHGMVRTEINCARCNGHLGHVFPDGPPPTGLRFCLNSASLHFVTRERAGERAEQINRSAHSPKAGA